jgi:hypothetical protein
MHRKANGLRTQPLLQTRLVLLARGIQHRGFHSAFLETAAAGVDAVKYSERTASNFLALTGFSRNTSLGISLDQTLCSIAVTDVTTKIG